MKIDTTKLNCESCKHYKVCKYKEDVQKLKEYLKRYKDEDTLITIEYKCNFFALPEPSVIQPWTTTPSYPLLKNEPFRIEPTWIGDDPNYNYNITCSSTSKQDPNVKITAINGETYYKDKFTKDWELSN